jgi:hypothetical protein
MYLTFTLESARCPCSSQVTSFVLNALIGLKMILDLPLVVMMETFISTTCTNLDRSKTEPKETKIKISSKKISSYRLFVMCRAKTMRYLWLVTTNFS